MSVSQYRTAFGRRAGDQVLAFQPDTADFGLMRDVQTGSMWAGASGEAVRGSLEGNRLSPLVTTPAFEFGWYSYFPESDTYTGP